MPGRKLHDARRHRLFGRTDCRRHRLRAREHAAGGSSRQRKQFCEDYDEGQPEHARHDGEERELETVTPQTVDEGRPDAKTDAVHEEIVEQAFCKIVQLEFHAVERRGDGERGADHDCTGDHAQSVALDTCAPYPYRKADDEEEQQKLILLEECKEALHCKSPYDFAAAAFGFVAPEGLPAPPIFASASAVTSFKPSLAS